MSRTNEAAFETVIELHLLASGYVPVDRDGFDRERAIFPEAILTFIRDTQPREWAKLEALHEDKTGEQILGDLCKWMDANGALATLRHGFKCYGRTLHVAFFKAAHELNPELEARYAANHLGLTRQLRFSPRSEKSLDVTLSLNGIPVVTLELKNALTGQTVENARHQYKHDRDPRELVFEFTRRTLVHFAVDTESVLMTTRLAGTATHFLPFNKGCDGGAGNPPDPAGRTYRTGYLWEEMLQRDSLLDILARFIHLQIEEKRDDQGRKVTTESMIFVRFMNDAPFQKIVTTWMASEAYSRLRSGAGAAELKAGARALPARLRSVEPKPQERYVTCVPFVPLKAAAGAFGDPRHIEDEGLEWVSVDSRHRLRRGMFVAQVVGKSMEPAIPDGSYCLFAAPMEGTRQGKTVLVQLRDATDPETGQRYTVKRYESEKEKDGDSWRHTRISLKALNPDFQPIVLTGADEQQLQVVAELVEVLTNET